MAWVGLALGLVAATGCNQHRYQPAQWRMESESKTTTPMAAGTTLPGTTLPGTTLPGTTLPGTTLPGTTLPGANVSGTTLPGSTLPR